MSDLVIIQSDRDAAADSAPHNGRWGTLVRSGHMDNDPLVQAFARRRISAEQATVDRIVAWLRSNSDKYAPEDNWADFWAAAIQRGDWK